MDILIWSLYCHLHEHHDLECETCKILIDYLLINAENRGLIRMRR